MARFAVRIIVLLTLLSECVAEQQPSSDPSMPPADVGSADEIELSAVTAPGKRLESYLRQREAEFGQIADDRKVVLGRLAEYVRENRSAERPARLLFICTHNSRRSHLAQVWATAAAAHYGVQDVEAFSGGTESTAFNPRAVAALERAGLEIKCEDPSARNPHYDVRFLPDAEPLVCFSKEFGQPPNPREDFCAVMTCSQADRDCPLVPGATQRIALPYDDPKASDGTPAESATYDARCAQIARELLFAFSLVPRAKP